jgi:HSP20 family protein
MANGLILAEEDKFTPIGEQMGRWMDKVLGASFRHFGPYDAWRPAINLCEFADHYCLVAELAGMQAGEIDLRIENGTLFITGQRPMPSNPDDKSKGEVRLHLMEIDQGPFLREVKLPDDVDAEAIEATYRSGYLWVRIPRKRLVQHGGR